MTDHEKRREKIGSIPERRLMRKLWIEHDYDEPHFDIKVVGVEGEIDQLQVIGKEDGAYFLDISMFRNSGDRCQNKRILKR